MTDSTNFKRSRSLSTLVVMGCTLITRILGFVKLAVINALFGASGQADVLNAVFSIPNNLRKLMAEGALSSAFIPELNKHLSQNQKEKAVKLSQTLLGFQYAVLIPLIALAMFYSDTVVNVFTHFTNPAQHQLAGQLFKYFAPYLLLVSISAILMAVLNSHHRFLIPSLSPLLFSVAVIAIIFWLKPVYGIYSMAIGVFVGGILQVIVQLPQYFKNGYRFMPSFHFNDSSFRRVLRHWLPVLLTSSVFAINQQISVYLASALEDGSSSALQNAIVFFNLPFGIFSASVNTVFFPRMSQQAHAKDLTALKESLTSGLKMLIVFLLPSMLIMIVLGKEIISVAFMRGAFKTWQAQLAASTLTGFCSGMIFVAAYNFIQRYFYSLGSFKTPFISAAITATIDISLSLMLIRTPLKVTGLAYANSIAFAISFILLSLLARLKYKSSNYKVLVLPLIKVLISCALAYGTYKLIGLWLGYTWWQQPSSLKTFGYLALNGLSMCAVVLVSYGVLKVDFLEGLRKPKKAL